MSAEIFKGNIHDLFPPGTLDGECLLAARILLSELISENIPDDEQKKKMNDFLDTSNCDNFLTTPLEILKDISPLAYLRQQLEGEKNEQIWRTPQSREKLPSQHSFSLILKKRRKSDKIITESSDSTPEGESEEERDRDNVVFLSTQEHLNRLTPQTTAVHLNKQHVVNIATIRHIVDVCPMLGRITVIPSLESLIGKGVREVLEKYPHIEIKIARFENSKQYDKVCVTERYVEAKKLFESTMRDPSCQELLNLMRKYDSIELLVAIMYFNEERISLRQLAEQLGLDESYVTRKLEIFQVWMGLSTQSEREKRKGQIFANKLLRMEKLEKSMEEEKRFRESMKVGDRTFPQSLPIRLGLTWKKITEFAIENPKEWREFKENYSKHFWALNAYYQIEGVFSKRMKYEDVQNSLGISRDQVRQLMNFSLSQLHLLDLEDEVQQS